MQILDGGLGGELIRRGVVPSSGMWSAKALLDSPDEVTKVHRDFIEAGADIIITNTYSTIPSYLGKSRLADRYEELTVLAAKMAREVADAADKEVLVAGCLPPLGESYRPDMVPADEAARPVYANLVSALEPYVDLFICETMSSIRKSSNAASMARQIAPRKPIWMAWTLAEEPGQGLRSGESVADAVAALESLQIDAFLFNCTSPTAITAGLESLSELTDKPTGAYPNRLHIPAGWTLDNDVTSGKIEMSVAEFVGFAEQWRQRGASIIGGCCGIGPEFIEGLKQARG